MKALTYENIENLIKRYEDRMNIKPNAILLPYELYKGIKIDYEEKFSRYTVKHDGEYKLFGLDIIPTFNITNIVPLRIYKEKHADKNEKELRKEIVKEIVKEIEKIATK